MEFQLGEIQELFKSVKSDDTPIENARARRSLGLESSFIHLRLQSSIDDNAIQFAKLDPNEVMRYLNETRDSERHRIILSSVLILNGHLETPYFDEIADFFASTDVLCNYKSYYYYDEKQICILKVKYLISEFTRHFSLKKNDSVITYLLVRWICSVIDLWNYLYEIC